MKQRGKKQPKINNIVKNSILKIVAFLIIVSLNWAGLSAVGRTLAYHFDNEDSSDNFFQATLLDFSVTNRHTEDFIGMEALSGIEFASVVTKKTGSLNIQYEVNAEKISGDEVFCDALKMEVEHNGVEKHDGSLLSFSAATTTELGTWEFEIDLPASATNVPHGAECNVDLVFKGWRSDVISFEESGFTDEERIELRLTSRMIVLNEFLPNPNGLIPDYGFDFGDDNSTMPQGEWVELYNNSDFSQDLADWYVWDDSGDSANKIGITTANTASSSTVIEAHNWLVVYMNKEVFDNDGDTVKLFNQNNELVDSHTYTGNDYCEMEPTPGNENDSDTGDDGCGGVPPNKSYARIPDGIGDWVDPVPTPGMANKLNEELIEEPIEELVEEPISDEIEEPVIEEEPTDVDVEATTTKATTTEETSSEELPTESATNTTESTIKEQQGGLTEVINDVIEGVDNIIDGIVDGIVEEIMSDQSGDESVEAPAGDMIVEDTVIESEPVEEITIIQQAPATEEQTAVLPSSDSDSGSSGDGGDSGDSGDGGGEGASAE